jgi:hypothetical protein
MYKCGIESFVDSRFFSKYAGKVNLILTSPPFPLNRKKILQPARPRLCYVAAELSKPLRSLLHSAGSIVLEMGNAWEPGQPVMSTLALEALLAFSKAGDLKHCQQFICHNPARLPSPAQSVTGENIFANLGQRIRFRINGNLVAKVMNLI